MANDEVLGPRKTMFVLVIVVGCFAVLWPRILSPLIVGHTSEQLKPNQFDRDAALKQERPPIRMGPHPALRERGRAIPPGPPPPSRPVTLPPHIRVRSPLYVYYEPEIKPPPIPGMRPPLGSPGGPVPAPKSSMGFVMPIYTICIIVFFVYTLSKILFKRTGSPYDHVTPDPQFRRRVFRDDSRTSPDKLVVSAISGLVAEVQQQMEASYTQNQQRQEALDNARPYTNGTILLNSGPVHIVTSEYHEPKEKSPELQKDKEHSQTKTDLENPNVEVKENLPSSEIVETKNGSDQSFVPVKEEVETEKVTEETSELKEAVGKNKSNELLKETDQENKVEVVAKVLHDVELDSTSEAEVNVEQKEVKDSNEKLNNLTEDIELNNVDPLTKLAEEFLNEEIQQEEKREKESTPALLEEAIKDDSIEESENLEDIENQSVKVVGMEMTAHPADGSAYRPEAPPVTPHPKPHKAEDVKEIYLETEIPQQSRVLVSDFAEDRADEQKTSKKDAQLVVSGKITLSLIQDAPRETPDRDLESTVDDFTTASGLTQPAAEKADDLSDEEIEEEIEVEEIEEIEEIEEEEEENEGEPKKVEK